MNCRGNCRNITLSYTIIETSTPRTVGRAFWICTAGQGQRSEKGREGAGDRGNWNDLLHAPGPSAPAAQEGSPAQGRIWLNDPDSYISDLCPRQRQRKTGEKKRKTGNLGKKQVPGIQGTIESSFVLESGCVRDVHSELIDEEIPLVVCRNPCFTWQSGRRDQETRTTLPSLRNQASVQRLSLHSFCQGRWDFGLKGQGG